MAILWLCGRGRPLRYHVPSAENKMALTADSQTVQLQDSWWYGHEVLVLNGVPVHPTCKGALGLSHRLHVIRK